MCVRLYVFLQGLVKLFCKCQVLCEFGEIQVQCNYYEIGGNVESYLYWQYVVEQEVEVVDGVDQCISNCVVVDVVEVVGKVQWKGWECVGCMYGLCVGLSIECVDDVVVYVNVMYVVEQVDKKDGDEVCIW